MYERSNQEGNGDQQVKQSWRQRVRQFFAERRSGGELDRRLLQMHEQDVDESDELMVLEDLDNGREYYLYAIDRFSVKGKPYAVMASFEPELGNKRIPDLVIMRYRLADDGHQYYMSIRDVEELDAAFDVFYDRLEKGMNS